MGQQYLSPQQGRVQILSLWDRLPGGPNFVLNLNLHFGLHQDHPALLPPISREQEFSQDTDPPGTLPGGSLYNTNGVPSQS